MGKSPSRAILCNSPISSSQMKRLAELGLSQAYLAHEIRRILVSVGLIARSIRKRNIVAGKDAKSIDSIIKRASHGESMLKEWLDFVDSGGREEVILDMNKLLTSARRALLPLANSRNVRIELKETDGDRSLICGDRRRLRQALLNICQNSIEAMPDRGGLLQLSSKTTAKGVALDIKDNGPGIKPDMLKNIFKPFFTTDKGGTGLGMALSHRIIHEHQGRIRARSEPSQGTSLRIWLPKCRKRGSE